MFWKHLSKQNLCYLFCSGTEQNNSIIETDIFTGTRTVRKCSKCKGPGHNRRNCTVWHVHVYHTDLNKHSGCLFKVGAYSRVGAFIENKKQRITRLSCFNQSKQSTKVNINKALTVYSFLTALKKTKQLSVRSAFFYL